MQEDTSIGIVVGILPPPRLSRIDAANYRLFRITKSWPMRSSKHGVTLRSIQIELMANAEPTRCIRMPTYNDTGAGRAVSVSLLLVAGISDSLAMHS